MALFFLCLTILLAKSSTSLPQGAWTSQFWEDTENEVGNAFNSASAAVSSTATSSYDYIASAVSSATSAAAKASETSMEAIKEDVESAKNMGTAFLSNVTKATSTAEDLLSNSSRQIASWGLSEFSAAKSSLQKLENDTGNFFSQSWNKVSGWWTELEDDVKDFVHLILKIVDILIGLGVTVFVVWVICKVRKAYRFLERHTSLPESVELRNL